MARPQGVDDRNVQADPLRSNSSTAIRELPRKRQMSDDEHIGRPVPARPCPFGRQDPRCFRHRPQPTTPRIVYKDVPDRGVL